MNEKSSDAFKSIAEVAAELAIPQHVLRFWETRFSQVKPLKRAGGRRYYRPEDVALLQGIRFLLYAKGFTIKGVQRLLREQGVRFVAATASGDLRPEEPSTAGTEPDDLREPQAEPYAGAIPDDFELTSANRDDPLEPIRPERSPAPERRSGGIGAFLKGRGEGAETAPSNLTKDQAARLQEVIFELLECKRILDQVR